jgi:hypothetical protein
MKLTPVPIQLAVLAALFFLGQACKRTPATVAPTVAQTAEDVRIGRQAMPISEVSLMLRGGTSQNALIADVNRRHIPEKISAALELDLKDKGAGLGLIAALKEENNVLSENQKNAFDKRMEGRVVPMGHGSQQSNAFAQSNAEQQEHQRLLGLQRDNLRNIEQNQAAQSSREQTQANSHYQFDGRNSGGKYATPRLYISNPTYQQSVTPPHN